MNFFINGKLVDPEKTKASMLQENQVSEYIQEALKGNHQKARELCLYFSDHLKMNEPIPQDLKNFMVGAMGLIGMGKDANTALRLKKKRGRGSENKIRDMLIAEIIIGYQMKNGLTKEKSIAHFKADKNEDDCKNEPACKKISKEVGDAIKFSFPSEEKEDMNFISFQSAIEFSNFMMTAAFKPIHLSYDRVNNIYKTYPHKKELMDAYKKATNPATGKPFIQIIQK